ncbi:hypothetical protein [Pelagicoccus mobilis]|uniref:6-bladed beta-propeller n=1 Tax=Pelagicoccus mobilis TaxID=415221 RepID=A0A934VKU4_9BACT|nr:hypothetical protein [Pelagicoccus mobilis]MBK1877056.1 hypothetical protein [Pelagicoccus mobilis]
MRLYTLLAATLLATSASSHPIGDHSHEARETIQHPTLVGNGQNQYRAIPNWAKFEDNKPIGATHGGIAIDASGKVYMSTNGERSICVFDTDGNFIRSIAPDCSGIHSLMIREENGEEFLYGAHLTAQRIVKLDLEGNIVLEIKHSDDSPIPGSFKGLTAVTVLPDGKIVAAIGYGSNFLHIFSPEGELLKTFGRKGTGYDETHTCHGISLDTRYDELRLLVSDRENRRLKHYTLEGEMIGVYSTHLRRPCAVSFFGELCAVAELQGRVTILDKNGTPVAFLGDNPNPKQWAAFKTPLEDIPLGIFTAPHGLSYDKHGNLYVQDWNATGRVTKLEKLK